MVSINRKIARLKRLHDAANNEPVFQGRKEDWDRPRDEDGRERFGQVVWYKAGGPYYNVCIDRDAAMFVAAAIKDLPAILEYAETAETFETEWLYESDRADDLARANYRFYNRAVVAESRIVALEADGTDTERVQALERELKRVKENHEQAKKNAHNRLQTTRELRAIIGELRAIIGEQRRRIEELEANE